MLKIAHKIEKEDILQKIREGKIDAVASSKPRLVDEIILSMKKNGIISLLEKAFLDKRADNTTVPFDLTLTLAIAAKMNVHTSLTDIPFAFGRTTCLILRVRSAWLRPSRFRCR